MKRIVTLLFILNTLIATSVFPQSINEHPSEYVNPFLGTDFFGHTFPGASLPFAMVHLSPDVDTQGWTYCAGYVYSENSIMGFSHTHWSGVGMVNGGEVLLMPVVGDKLQIIPGSKNNPDEGYRSRFSHDEESRHRQVIIQCV